jgi:SAM-dependent methyltransferase
VASTPQPDGSRGWVRTIWRRACRFSFTKERRSRRILDRFCRGQATHQYTLVVHSDDVDHRRYFPNSFIVSKKKHKAAHLHTGPYFHELATLDGHRFDVALCTGLLEHVPDPERLVAELHRLLKPDGRLIVSASAVFPAHGGPDNFYHFTASGFRHLFRDWSRFEVLMGSSRPFETIAILLQRINMQCDILPPLRPVIELLQTALPWLDVCVTRQYSSPARREEGRVMDSIMPATILAVVVK